MFKVLKPYDAILMRTNTYVGPYVNYNLEYNTTDTCNYYIVNSSISNK